MIADRISSGTALHAMGNTSVPRSRMVTPLSQYTFCSGRSGSHAESQSTVNTIRIKAKSILYIKGEEKPSR